MQKEENTHNKHIALKDMNTIKKIRYRLKITVVLVVYVNVITNGFDFKQGIKNMINNHNWLENNRLPCGGPALCAVCKQDFVSASEEVKKAYLYRMSLEK